MVWLPLDLSLVPIALEIDEKIFFPFHKLQLFNKNFCIVPIAFLHETSFTSVFKIERAKVKIYIFVWWHSLNPDPDTEIKCSGSGSALRATRSRDTEIGNLNFDDWTRGMELPAVPVTRSPL